LFTRPVWKYINGNPHTPGRIEAISKEKKGIWILRRIVTELRGELYASLAMQSRESDGGGGTAGCWSGH